MIVDRAGDGRTDYIGSEKEGGGVGNLGGCKLSGGGGQGSGKKSGILWSI